MIKRKGIASLLIVIFVTIFCVLVISSWQSRGLLSMQRGVALSDNLRATYHAESEINDVISRIMGNYPLPSEGTQTLEDGTVLTLSRAVSGTTETIDVHAKRQFASTNIQVSKTTTPDDSTDYDKVEIILAADCTVSMDDQADPSCVGTCANRISKEKEAILDFIDAIRGLPNQERNKFYLGIMTFKIGYQWITDGGTEMRPTQDLTGLQNAVQHGFGTFVSGSRACDIVNPDVLGVEGETSLGSPTVFAADYLRPLADARKKQIYILITDGMPNSSLTENRCGTIGCRSGDGGSCNESAFTYLECGLADTDTIWSGARFGLRDPKVDVYAVLTSNVVTEAEQAVYDRTVSLFQNPDYVKHFYNSNNAEDLTSFLSDIFHNILTSVTRLEIKRVVPTPVR